MDPSRNSTSETAPDAPFDRLRTGPSETRPVPDDSELLRQIERGSEQAFAALLERHGRYLHGVALALVQNPADAEDLVQETFMAVLRGGFRGESQVRTWLVKI